MDWTRKVNPVSGIHEGGGDAVLGFLDGGVGQADERHCCQQLTKGISLEIGNCCKMMAAYAKRPFFPSRRQHVPTWRTTCRVLDDATRTAACQRGKIGTGHRKPHERFGMRYRRLAQR